jgi:hypothetical protein
VVLRIDIGTVDATVRRQTGPGQPLASPPDHHRRARHRQVAPEFANSPKEHRPKELRSSILIDEGIMAAL